MSNTETKDRNFWPISSRVSLLVIGLALIALSVAWPKMSDGSSGWTNDKAESYQAASAELHRLSMQMADAPAEDQSRARQDAIAAAQHKYADLRADLDNARSRPARIATILRYSGILLAIVGAYLLWSAGQKTSSSAS